MIENISPNDFGNLISAGTGALFGFIARGQQNRHELNKLNLHLLSLKFKTNLEDQHEARLTQSLTMSLMRFIMIGVIGSSILILFLLPGFFHWKVNIETIHDTGFFFPVCAWK